MITLSMGVFFWLSIGYLTLKKKMKLAPYVDLIFITIIIFFMSGINMSALSDCGSPGNAILYTIVPWVFIFLPMIGMLYYFPHWKKPFSNTLGYFIISFNKKNIDTLISLLKDKEKNMMYVLTSPWVLINQFTSDMFAPKEVTDVNATPEKEIIITGATVVKPEDEIINITGATVVKPENEIINITGATVVKPEDERINITGATVVKPDKVGGSSGGNIYLDALNLADTKNILYLKDVLELKEMISLWAWYMLTALITISTSYTLIMNSSCSKDKKEPEKVNPKSR
jgi:hypothetical protein